MEIAKRAQDRGVRCVSNNNEINNTDKSNNLYFFIMGASGLRTP